MLAVELNVIRHSLLLPDIVVEPKATVPPMLVRVRPDVVLDVVVTLVNFEVEPNVPLVRLSAWPLPFKVISGVVLSPTVSVPKLAPEAIFAPVVFPIVKPRNVLLKPTPILMPLVEAATVVTVGFAPPDDGRVLLSAEGVTPAIE